MAPRRRASIATGTWYGSASQPFNHRVKIGMSDTDARIIANVERLHVAMDRCRLAAAVARSGLNFTYLAGFAHPGTLARHLDLTNSMRGVLLIWPRQASPSSCSTKSRRDWPGATPG